LKNVGEVEIDQLGFYIGRERHGRRGHQKWRRGKKEKREHFEHFLKNLVIAEMER
jgi:hypothetical protein